MSADHLAVAVDANRTRFEHILEEIFQSYHSETGFYVDTVQVKYAHFVGGAVQIISVEVKQFTSKEMQR